MPFARKSVIARWLLTRRKSSISTFKLINIGSEIRSLGRKHLEWLHQVWNPMFSARTVLKTNLHRTAWRWSSKVLTTLWHNWPKPKKRRRRRSPVFKEDFLLHPDSGEEAEEEDSNKSNTQLNISAMLNNVLDPSDSGVAKKFPYSDSAEWCPWKPDSGICTDQG